MDYVEKRLEGHSRIEVVALPVVARIRDWFNEPALNNRRKHPFVIPPPPPLQHTTNDMPPVISVTEESKGRTLRVGPLESIRSTAEAALLARDGDIVEIQAGEYHADVATWLQKKLTIRGIGGNARLFADSKSAEDKAIWVIRNGDFDISNIDFIGARVADRNGAGIRFENGHLHIRNCLFWGNENGILATGGKAQRNATIEIENSEFAYNGSGDGQSHNIYIGAIGALTIKGSYFHHANVGHLIKSRAATNMIAYNRLTDESGGRASYELEFPNGGIAHVVGNVIQKNRETENSTLISYGMEGYSWPSNRLYLGSNTLINDHPYGGAFLRVAPGVDKIISANNLLTGKGRYHVPDILQSFNDIHTGWEIYNQPTRYDYRLNKSGQKLAYQSLHLSLSDKDNLKPQYEYVLPNKIRVLAGNPTYAGALQTIE